MPKTYQGLKDLDAGLTQPTTADVKTMPKTYQGLKAIYITERNLVLGENNA